MYFALLVIFTRCDVYTNILENKIYKIILMPVIILASETQVLTQMIGILIKKETNVSQENMV